MNLVNLGQQVAEIARRAGAVILEVYQDESKFGVEQKADESPLTVADRKANSVICTALEQLEPKFPIISEENKLLPYAQRKDYDHFWLVDPLDGTKEFIKRNGEFTVNIALIKGQQPILGIVYVPVTDEMYIAAKGHGTLVEKNGERKQLQAADFALTDSGLQVVCSRSHLNADTQAFVDRLQNPQLVPQGSSLKFTILAKGKAHVYPRLGPTMEWDTAAAQIVLEEAGGKVISERTGKPLEYNKENLLNPYFIAYGSVRDN